MKKLFLFVLLGFLFTSIFVEANDSLKDQYGNLIPENCSSWYDGCNNCMVVEDGSLACTKMYCETPNEPKCNDTKEEMKDSYGNIVPSNCSSWYDGCNNCMVGENGLLACTLMYCEETNEPKCNDIQEEDNITFCTMEYAPVCAEVQVQCIKTPCHPIQQTFGNKCMMEANSLATFLYTGECNDDYQQANDYLDNYFEENGDTYGDIDSKKTFLNQIKQKIVDSYDVVKVSFRKTFDIIILAVDNYL